MDHLAGIVRFEGQAIAIAEEQELLVGRGSSADIRVGRNPTDGRVSREHVLLSMAGGLVTVTRKSQSQLVVVRSTGVDYTLNAPGEAVTRAGLFEVLLPKTPAIAEEQPSYYRLSVWTPGPDGAADPAGPLPGESTATSTARLPDLSPRERQLLSAYARPLVSPSEASRLTASTHRQVAGDLHYSYDWVREQIDRLRTRLASQGWPVGPDKDSLALWAVTSGLIARSDVNDLDLD
jgi:hypothetical protein